MGYWASFLENGRLTAICTAPIVIVQICYLYFFILFLTMHNYVRRIHTKSSKEPKKCCEEVEKEIILVQVDGRSNISLDNGFVVYSIWFTKLQHCSILFCSRF